jgi:hypothetical protein
MTADGAFVPEATSVRPYLVCIQANTVAPNSKAAEYFHSAATNYNAGKWHDAGKFFGMAVMETCPNPPPVPSPA